MASPPTAQGPPPPASPPEPPAAPRPRRRFRLLRGLLRGLMWTLVGLIVLVLAVFVFLQTDFGRELVRGFVVDAVNDGISGHIEVDRLDGMLPFAVTLEGVRIYTPEGERALAVEALSADFHPFALFDQTIKLSDVRISAPEFNLLDSEGGIGIVRAFEPREPSPADPSAAAWQIELERIHIEQALIANLVGDSDLVFADTTLDMSFAVEEAGLVWRRLVLSTRPSAPLPREVTVRSHGRLDGTDLVVRRLTVQAGPHFLSLDGRVDLGDLGADGAIDLNLRALTLDLDLLPDAAPALPLAGRLELDGRVLLADGLLTGELAGASALGRVDLQLGVDLNVTPFRYEGALHLADIYPAALRDLGLPRDFLADGALTFEGAGDPRAPHHLALRGELVELAPTPGGRISFELAQPAGAVAGPDDPWLATLDFAADVSDLDLSPWTRAFGQPELSAFATRLDASGQLTLMRDGPPRIVVGGDADVSARGRLAGSGDAVEADNAYASFELQWAGGLPLGDLAATLVAARFGDAHADFADVSATLVRGLDDRVSVRGHLTAQDAGLDPDVAVGRVNAPFDLELPDLDGPPEGVVELDVGSARAFGQRVGAFAGRFRVRRAAGGLRVVGTYRASRGVSDAGVRFARATGSVDTWLGFNGLLDGQFGADVARLVVPGAAVAQLRVDARVDARRGLRAGATAVGSFSARGVEAGSASVGAADGDFDVSLSGDGPVGRFDARVRAARLADCFAGRACGVERLTLDGRLQAGGKIAYDVRIAQRELEVSLLGVVSLPLGRALAIDLDRLVVAQVTAADDGGAQRDQLLVADRIRYVPGGRVDVGSLKVVAPRGAAGELSVKGAIDPVSGALDFELAATGVSVEGWLERIPPLVGLIAAVDDDDSDPPPTIALGLPRLAGTVNVGGYVRGTLAAPQVRLTVTVSDGRVDDLDGIAFGGTLEWNDAELALGLGGRWHSGGRLDARLRVAGPVGLSLAPFGVVVADDADLAIDLKARDDDLTATQRFLTGVGAGRRLAGTALAGEAELRVEASGSITRPAFLVAFDARPLSVGAYEDGAMRLAAESRNGSTRVELALDGPPRDGPVVPAAPGKEAPRWPERKPLVRLDLVAPFDVAELLDSADTVALVRERLRTTTPDAAYVKLNAGRMTLAETPLEAFIGPALRRTEVAAQLSVAGPMPDLALESSRVEVNGLGLAASNLVLELREERGDLAVLLTGSSDDARVFRGSLVVPDLATLALTPAAAERLLEDPRLKLTLFTEEMTAGELWDFNQSLGEIATRFMPDARAMVHVNASGAPGGPVANVLARLRNGRPADLRGDFLDRNIADDLRLVVRIDAQRATVALRVTQDKADEAAVMSDRPAEVLAAADVDRIPPDCTLGDLGDSPFSFAVFGRADLGTAALLRGEVPDVKALPLDARIHACGLQLGRIGRALGAMFGPSRGRLDGQAVMTGTLEAPRFEGSLVADFKQLDIDAVGFHRDRFAVGLTFEERAIALVPIRLEGKPAREGGESYLELGLRADIERLDPAGIRLDGRLAMRDFPLVDTRDAKARLAGDVTVGGTIARLSVEGQLEVLSALYQREFGGRSVRPLGIPEDVVLVVGAPVPPDEEEEVAASGPRTGARIDVRLTMPRGQVVIDNELLRVVPWTDDLRVRTVGGELAITGTIHVPQEKIALYGKTFMLAPDSRVVFTGDMATDPQLLISATYDISEIDLSPIGLTTTPESRATVSVTGNAESPRLTLSSDPPMDEANIVNVIVFDAPVGQGEGEDSAMRNQVANLVIGLATGSMARFVTEQLPIDTFQLDTRSGDLSESRLTVGKRLAKNLFFRYRRNIGATGERESANEFSAEYRVGPVTLLGNYGDIGEFSVEANLRIRD